MGRHVTAPDQQEYSRSDALCLMIQLQSELSFSVTLLFCDTYSSVTQISIYEGSPSYMRVPYEEIFRQQPQLMCLAELL